MRICVWVRTSEVLCVRAQCICVFETHSVSVYLCVGLHVCACVCICLYVCMYIHVCVCLCAE